MKATNLRSVLSRAMLAAIVVWVASPLAADAANMGANRKLTLSSSSPSAGATVTYTFNFTVPTTTTAIRSFQAQICLEASGSCTTPTGFVNSSSISQPSGFGTNTAWSGNNATAGSLRMTHASNAVNPTASQTVTFNNVTNPTTTNQTFYARLTTYSDSAWGTPIDTGVVAASTATPLALDGQMPESLVFCVGTSLGGSSNCSTVTGSTVSFGFFSPTAARTQTSVMSASSNAGGGYAITVNGATLTSGANTIPALATQTASATGTSQFGMNVSRTSGDAAGAPSAFYNVGTSYRFVTGDTVAASAVATDQTNYQHNYLVNVAGKQAAGNYTTTLTYICTATF